MQTDQVRNDPFRDPQGEASPFWRWRVTLPVVMIVLIVAFIAVVSLRSEEKVAAPHRDYCDGPSGGLVRIDGECIGVTDGSFLLAEGLAREEQQIIQQNAAIQSQRSVTVAVFNPLTPDAKSALGIDEIKHQLQGVIAAQKWLNADAAAGNSAQIRLVLANQGSHQQHWSEVVEQLNEMQDDPSPLVAVVGMGVSVAPTLDAAKKLSEYGIPQIGAITTADTLNQAVAPGFFRVSPANRDYIEALKPWAQGYSSKLLVYDAASDDVQPDIFTKTLRDDFSEMFDDSVDLPSVNYHGSENGEKVQVNRFRGIRSEVCNGKISLVLFAGRRNDLEVFLKALILRTCTTPVTVMVGGTDLGGVTDDKTLADAHISLVWSAGADATAWESGKNPPQFFSRFLSTYRGLYPKDDLADGEAVAGWDALTAVGTAIGAVEIETEGDEVRPLPSGIDVRGELLNTGTKEAIAGASGNLSYERRAPELSGNPINKPIPVLHQGIPVTPLSDELYLTK